MARGSVYKRCPCGVTGTPAKGKKPSIPACRKKHGTWWFRVEAGRDPVTGKRRQPSQGGFATRDDAEEALGNYVADLRAGTAAADLKTTVAKWLRTWLDEVASTLEPSTVVAYRRHVESYIVPALGAIRLRDLRRSHVEALWAELGKLQDTEVSRRDQVLAFVAARADGVPVRDVRAEFGEAGASHLNDLRRAGAVRAVRRGVYVAVADATAAGGLRRAGRGGSRVMQRSPRTVDSVRRTLRAALSAAVRRGLISVNVASGRMDAIGKLGRAESDWWEPAELAAFLDAADVDRWAALWVVAAFSGLRRGELCGIRWADVTLTGPTPGITVRQRVMSLPGEHVCPVCGAVHRGRRIRPGAKTEAGVRWVPLTGDSVRELIAHRAAQEAARVPWGSDYNDHDLVFCLEDGSPLQPNDVTKRHAEIVKAAGLRPIRLHDMRHTAASLLLAGGMPVELVSLILGHSSPAVTRAVYAHVLRAPALEGAEAGAALVRPARGAQSVHSAPGSSWQRPGGDATK